MLDLVRVAVGAAAIFLLPGYALLALARRQLDFDPVEALCMAVGLSLAAIPLALYATTLLGIRQGPGIVLALLVACAAVAAWDGWGGEQRRSRATLRANEPGASPYLIYGALALVFILTLVGRLWSVQGIDFPLWTDPYAHTVITQLIVDTGMVPTTYEPYAPIHEFTYHFGFHALAAWFHWVTGVPVPHSLVIAGQILNALVVPTTYLFVQRLFQKRSAGLMAAVIVGWLSHMPVQFVNWGRYTQLDGQILLPVAIALYITVLRLPTRQGRALLLTALVFAGLFLAHYRIFIFAVLLAAILFVLALSALKRQERTNLLVNTIWIAAMGLVVLGPWLWRLAGGFGGNYARTVVGGYQEEVHGTYFGFELRELVEYGMHGYLWGAAALGVLWGVWRREWRVVALLLWVLGMFAGANLHLINFTPLYSNTIVILMLYLPLAALGGYGTVAAASWLAGRLDINLGHPPGWAAALFVLLIVLGVMAVQRDVRIVAPENGFVRAGDLEAMAWIEQEIPEDALFYIPTIFWTPTVAHGLDGGYYLPLLAARQTIMPPQNYASDGTMDYRALVNQRLRDLAAAPDAHALGQTMRDYGITHVYLGERESGVSADLFLGDPADFELLYDRDHVRIFAVIGAEVGAEQP
ncbi:MAG: hypothetical protein IT328_20890 [Caldilineaceae bacterium]|nr:hypothetical protein [Caldilineaceae bacterium]